MIAFQNDKTSIMQQKVELAAHCAKASRKNFMQHPLPALAELTASGAASPSKGNLPKECGHRSEIHPPREKRERQLIWLKQDARQGSCPLLNSALALVSVALALYLIYTHTLAFNGITQ